MMIPWVLAVIAAWLTIQRPVPSQVSARVSDVQTTTTGTHSVPDQLVTIEFRNHTSQQCTVTGYQMSWGLGGRASGLSTPVVVGPQGTATTTRVIQGPASVGLTSQSSSITVTANCI